MSIKSKKSHSELAYLAHIKKNDCKFWKWVFLQRRPIGQLQTWHSCEACVLGSLQEHDVLSHFWELWRQKKKDSTQCWRLNAEIMELNTEINKWYEKVMLLLEETNKTLQSWNILQASVLLHSVSWKKITKFREFSGRSSWNLTFISMHCRNQAEFLKKKILSM